MAHPSQSTKGMHANTKLLSLTSLLLLVASGCSRSYEADGDMAECSIDDDCDGETGNGQDSGETGGSRDGWNVDADIPDDDDGHDFRRPNPPQPPMPPVPPMPSDPGCEGVDDGRPFGCTYTQGFWQNHEQQWPATAVVDLCGFSGMELLMQPVEGDAWMNLAHQYIAAELNVANGASTTCDLDVAMYKAKLLLDECELVDEVDISAALQLAAMLDAYNNGDIGPGHCG